jgi:hypothetical protein
MEYTIEDMKFAFEYAKNNTNSKFKDMIRAFKNRLTDDELSSFANIRVAIVDISGKNDKKAQINILKWIGVGGGHFAKPFSKFKEKYYRDGYIYFTHDGYSETNVIVSGDSEVFSSENFEKVPDTDILTKTITINDSEILLNADSHEFSTYRNRLREHDLFYNIGSDWYIFTKNIYNLEYVSALDILKNLIEEDQKKS